MEEAPWERCPDVSLATLFGESRAWRASPDTAPSSRSIPDPSAGSAAPFRVFGWPYQARSWPAGCRASCSLTNRQRHASTTPGRRAIHPALTSADVGDVAEPASVGPLRLEHTAHEVGRGLGHPRVRGYPEAANRPGHDLRLMRGLATVFRQRQRLELAAPHERAAHHTSGGLPHRPPGSGGQQDTAPAAGAGRTAARGIVPAWRDPEHPTHRAHAVAALVGLDEAVLHVNSRAK